MTLDNGWENYSFNVDDVCWCGHRRETHEKELGPCKGQVFAAMWGLEPCECLLYEEEPDDN